jgi:hypothetical protein
MKSDQFLNETTSGAIASVSMPLGKTQKRAESVEVKGLKPVGKKTTSKNKGPYANSIVEGIETKKVSEAELQEDDLIIIPGQKLKRRNGFVPKDQSRVDHEVEMARSDLIAAYKNAKSIFQMLKDRSEEEGIEGWVQEKLIKANDYLNAVKEYYDGKMMREMSGGVIAAGGVGESSQSWQDEFADMVNQMKKSGRLGMPKSNYNFKTPEPKSKEELMSRLKELEAEFDPAYQQSDDYSFWKKQNDIASEISSIRRQLRQQGVAEGSLNEFAPTYHSGDDERDGKKFNKGDIVSHNNVKGIITSTWKDNYIVTLPSGEFDLWPMASVKFVSSPKQGMAEGSLNESDKFTSWYDWKDQAISSGYTITKKDDKIVALNKQGQIVGHWSDVGKFLSGKAPRPNFNAAMRAKKNLDNEQGVAEAKSQLTVREENNLINELRALYVKADLTSDEAKRAVEIGKILGRGSSIYNDWGRMTIGQMIDKIVIKARKSAFRGGNLPQFTGQSPSTVDLAQQIAIHTNGSYYYKRGIIWTDNYGRRRKDPSDYVEYRDEDSYNDAIAWIESKGKKVHYRDRSNTLHTATQIGKFIVEPSIRVEGVFSDSPTTSYAISVRSVKAIGSGGRTKADISDQQAAALTDLARTKTDNAMNGIRSILSILRDKQDIKNVIDNSKKLDSNVKAKLDAIIAGAANFKEPDQGLSEGLPKKKLKEIDFSSSLGELSISQEDLINNASNDGSIGSRKVYIFKSGPTKIYFFTDENKIAALVYLYQDRIMGMKNFSKNKGLIYNLFQYIINIKKQKVKLTPKDKLTPDGIKWIIDQIRRADGFKITDARGNKIDPNTLYDEWENSRLSGSNGPTEIVISESSNSKEIRDNESRLMPMDIFGATLKNIDENYPKRNTMTNILETDIMSGLISEKAKSKAQQRFFGMAHALQKGKKIPGASAELKQVAKSMGKKDVKDFAKTKHKNLPTNVKKG